MRGIELHASNGVKVTLYQWLDLTYVRRPVSSSRPLRLAS